MIAILKQTRQCRNGKALIIGSPKDEGYKKIPISLWNVLNIFSS